MIDKALEHAKDLYEAVKEKHAEAKAAFEETERLIRSGGIGQNSQHQQLQGGGQGQYGQPIHYPGAQQQQQQQDPYGYQANQYSQPGLTAPLPPGEAPPPPPAAPGQDQAASATAAAGAAQNGMTTEQWTAYWNSLDPASQAYYTQYVGIGLSLLSSVAIGSDDPFSFRADTTQRTQLMDNNLKHQPLKLPLLRVLLHLHHRQMMRRKVEEVLMVLYRLHLDCREVERRRGFFLVVPLFQSVPVRRSMRCCSCLLSVSLYSVVSDYAIIERRLCEIRKKGSL